MLNYTLECSYEEYERHSYREFKMLHFSLFLLGTLSNVMSMGLPEYINSCSRSDPNLNECALKSARESIHRFSLGDPTRGLPPLDPLYVEKMEVYVPNQSGFKVVFKDNHFTGLSNLQMESLRFDLDKKLITAEALVNLDVKNNYELSGRVFVVPISSSGDSSIKLKNTMLHIKFWYEHVEGPDGNIHWKIYKHDIKYNVERAIFRLENLLNDKNLGEQINRILNEMWREIVTEVGPTICHSLSSAVVENLGVLLSQVSYDELMPE